MRHRPFNLAIETSDQQGWVSLGRESTLLESVGVGSSQVKQPGLSPRRGGDLMPTIDALCQKHNVQPGDIGEIYVSTGPGSFTGLRVAVTTARMLARFLEVRVVAVPTIEVIAQQIPTDAPGLRYVAIALNHKRQTAYAAIYHKLDNRWQAIEPPGVIALADLLAQYPGDLALVAPGLPASVALPQGVRRLADELGQPHSDSLWLLGQRYAKAGQFADPRSLVPIYARPPEAVELWNQRHGQA